ncbi:MAG: hypothetical protein M3297_09925, partial [Thermoproteota archaeon]|nr:hypothetical protein [Thermoproteota archaeon]
MKILLGGNVVTGATMALKASLKTIILPVPESWMHDEWIPFVAKSNHTTLVHGDSGGPSPAGGPTNLTVPIFCGLYIDPPEMAR